MSGYIGTQPVPQATQTRDVFTATSGQTSFATSGYTPNFLDVWLNGVKLVNGDDFTATNGSDVVLASGATTGDTVEVLSYSTFEVADRNFTGDTSAENFTVTGTFTSRGIDDNATSTAVTLDASGNLLVGKTITSSTENGFEFRNTDLAVFVRDGGNPLYLNRKTSDGDIVTFNKDGTTVGSIGSYAGDLIIGTGDTYLRFEDSYDVISPRNANGTGRDAAVSLGVPSVRFKDLYLSGGVYLGGTGAANLLDDYEEGTWTPTPAAGLTSISVYGANYVKVGNMVTIWLSCALTGDGTSTQVQIGGLPFVHAGGSAGRGDATPWIDYANYGSNLIPRASIFGGATWISLYAAYTNSKVNQISIPGGSLNTSEFNLNISYLV